MREVVSIGGSLKEPHQLPWQELLAFADVSGQQALLQVNRSWFQLVERDCSVAWKVLREAAAREFGVYLSPHPLHATGDAGRSWKALHREVMTRRGVWAPAAAAAVEAERFNIRVCARFRPRNPRDEAQRQAKRVVLPLHQRLEGIKRTRGVETTREAAKVLFNGQEEDRPAEARPAVLDVQPTGEVVAMAPGVGLRAFKYDAAFPGCSTQEEVYQAAAACPVAHFLNGGDACCIVFGQTGSGKTHTMFGGAHPGEGVVPRACREVFAAFESRTFVLSQLYLSYIEVFGDEVTDLLDGGARVAQNKSAAQRWVLEGRVRHSVHSLEHVLALLDEGDAQKKRAATKMNERSSRAHCLAIFTLEQRHVDSGSLVESTLVLADLGGAEDVKKSGAGDEVCAPGMAEGAETADWNGYYRKRERLSEAVNINRGLLALKNCVRALHEREQNPDIRVPYHESKLTALLAPVLGGNARVSVLVTASPAPSDALETVHSLRFGEDCRSIVTSSSRADATRGALREMVAALDQQIEAAQDAVRKAEKWVQKKVKRERERRKEGEGEEEEDTGVRHDTSAASEESEIVTVYRLEGAEEEGARLEELLERRRRLLGCA